MKQRDTFGNPLKEKLNDFRVNLLTMDEILEFIYKNNSEYIEKMLLLQNAKIHHNKESVKESNKK
tara:strand:- start:1656 stop:1850 length:195 start_codon:yes stop_codon:yes gene_type:complete